MAVVSCDFVSAHWCALPVRADAHWFLWAAAVRPALRTDLVWLIARELFS